MERKAIKLKDYVTHERVPVRGDSHGNFTLSPLGFPFVNRSGYERGSRPPTTFTVEMISKPELATPDMNVSAVLEYNDEFKFPRTDSDNDTFLVKATLKAVVGGYAISSDSASFNSNAVVTIAVDDAAYEQINGNYPISENAANRIDIQPMSLPAAGISCTVTFRPELTDVDPIFIKFTGCGENNGVYKLLVSHDDNGILHYKWMYKTSNVEVCTGEVTFDGTENDNVHDHYRNRFSDEEVADYIKHALGPAIECGKFRGEEYPVDAQGLLVKWFLSHGAIVHSVAGKTVVLDGFGHVLAKNDVGDCSGVTNKDEHGTYGIGRLNEWMLTTSGEDYPTSELGSANNNITVDVGKSGERHTFIIHHDLSDMVEHAPRKTFIHLPTELNLDDGTEVELNVAMPVITQPADVSDVEAAIKSYTDYVAQPRVYILTGKQNTLPNNSVLDSGISTGSNYFELTPKNDLDVENGTAIAFGLKNRFECPRTFYFNGVVVKEGDDPAKIHVDDKTFPFNRSSRRWKMYSKDATCIVDIRTVDGEGGLTEYTNESGAFNNDTSVEPELVDNDSIVATIYPTSTNTFPWRLNGRNRVRHLGLTTSASVDYNERGKPLTRLVYEMNDGVYKALSGITRGSHPIGNLRYDEENSDNTVGNSVIGSLLRVKLPATLFSDISDTNKDGMYVVANATKAFHELIGDFKVARVGYESSRGFDNKEVTKWGYGDPNTPTPNLDGDDNLQRLNDWETKIIHLPNYCLGVDAKLERNLAYAGWNEFTNTQNFRIFYDPSVDDFVEQEGYGASLVGNRHYLGFKDDSGTTQRTVDSYTDDVEGDSPFNYTVENSVYNLFVKGKDEKTRNQYGAFVHGFLDLPIIKRGLRTISWLTDEASEFSERTMEPFYPNSHVISTDGVAFPEMDRNALREVVQSSDEDVKRALLAFPDKVVSFTDETTSELAAELISVNMPSNDDNRAVVDYMKSLLTMYSNGMPLHMYDAHRAINVDTASDDYEDLLLAHEITLYNRNASSADIQEQHRYCDLATNSTDGQGSEDVNMTYNFITENALETDAAVSLTSPLESVSAEFIANVFGTKIDEDDRLHNGMYTRFHVTAVFSASLGKWVVKDYRQYPTCYLTPLYGANTLDYTEKSYANGNPAKYENRVQKSAGMVGDDFNIIKYLSACEEQPLWQLPCGVGTDYRDGMYTRYSEQPPLEMNPGCIPFLMERFPYESDGTLNNSFKFRNLYESISTPMDANGDSKEGSVPEVNFWNIKQHIRPARCAYPGADVPSNSARTGGTIGEPTLGGFRDLDEHIDGEIILTDDMNENVGEYLITDLAHIGPDIEVEPEDERVPYVVLTDSDDYDSLVYDEPDPEGSSTKYVGVFTDNYVNPRYEE